MPKTLKQALSDAAIRTLKPRASAYPVTDGDGLFLLVRPTGTKSWRLSYYFNRKQRRLCLGSYPEIGLKRAREMTAEARAHVAAGVDPLEIKREERRKKEWELKNTFEAVAWQWYEEKAPVWAISYAREQKRCLKKNVLPVLGALPMTKIKAPLLVGALKEILAKGKETAKKARISIQGICRFALLNGLIEADPSTALKDAIPAPEGKHFAAPRTVKEVGAILRALDSLKEVGGIVQYALRLHPLLAVRPGELLGARWADIDLETKEWRFIAPKTKRHHVVPLSRQALEILKELQAISGRFEWVFPNLWRTERHITNAAMRAHLRRIEIGPDALTPHGWRAVFRTLGAEECGFSFDVLEAQLGHAVPDVLGRAYNRAEWMAQRREAMQNWADFLDKAKVQ